MARWRGGSRAPRRGRCSPPAPDRDRGASFLEVSVVLAVLGILALHAAPTFVGWRQRQRLEVAVRHLALDLGRACTFAAVSGTTHALRFDSADGGLGWTLVADGDGDGVSRADLADGIDEPVDAVDVSARLENRFRGILAGRPSGVPTIAGGAADRAGLAFGGSTVVSCSAAGGARSGTLYLHNGREDSAAVRLYGPTARVSLWWWDGRRGRWQRMR